MNIKNLFDIYGESHTRFIGMTFYYAKVGMKIDMAKISEQLVHRQGISQINTARKELEKITFLSGVENGIITDSKISFVLENKNYRPRDYEFGIARPSHADIVGYQLEGDKYSFEGGGRFSGRLTALYVVIGELCHQHLLNLYPDLQVQGHIKQVNDIFDVSLPLTIAKSNLNLDPLFPVIDQTAKAEMLEFLKAVRQKGESHGALLEYAISGLPVGIGGMYQHSFESILSMYLYGIGGIKGINFGAGQEYVKMYGSEANDEYYVENNQIDSKTNLQGGINGGFTNGIQDVMFNVVVRPTPTIFKSQNTVRLTENGWVNYIHEARGRHDSFIANRVQVVVKNMVYVAIYHLVN